MRLLKSVISDIRKGISIDIYVTMLLSFIVLILSIFGIVETRVTISAILAVLLLLAISRLYDKKELVKIREAVSGGGSQFHHLRDEDFAKLIKESEEIWMVSVANFRFLASNISAFKEFLQKGGRLRSIYLYPDDSKNLFIASARAIGASRSYEHIRKQVELTTDKIRELRQLAAMPAAVEAKQTKYVTSVVFSRFRSLQKDVIYLTLPGFQQATDKRSTVVVDKFTNGREFEFFVDFFNNLWNWEHSYNLE
jgi:hypothetical protein